MANEQITKEEIRKIMEIPGKVRGVVLQTDAEYVRRKKGEEGVQALKKKTKEWGFPIEYEKILATEWYPLGLRVISLLAVKEVFSWGDKEIFDMGNSAPKYSFIVKMLMKTFLTLKKTFEECPKYWIKHYMVGVLENYKYNDKGKYLILRLKDFKIHPILCLYLSGYFLRIGQYGIKGGKKITVQETKCIHKGDAYHEFVIKWE